MEQGEQPCHILQRVQRLHERLTGAQRLARFVGGIGFLNMRAVLEHDLRQAAGFRCGADRTAKALLVQQRQQSRVVDVRMGQQYDFDLCRSDGQRSIFKFVFTLLHAPVDQQMMAVDLQERAAPGHFVVCTKKSDPHDSRPPVLAIL